MRAFLSHSSKDKTFVRQVYEALGEAQCEYDEATFEYKFNVQAIRSALKRCDLFVYFLSNSSIASTFVGEEHRATLESRGAGVIRQVMIFVLDSTTYRSLPEWLREINVVQKLSSPKVCARKMQSALFRLDAEREDKREIYLGRDVEDRALAKALSGAPEGTPLTLHAVGHYGVGRTTFLRHNLQKLFPRRFDTFIRIIIAVNQGIEDLYRQLYDARISGSLETTIKDVEEYAKKSLSEQCQVIADMVQSAAREGEFFLIVDSGGVYTEEGDFQPYIRGILDNLDGRGLPLLGFVQTRMMPSRVKVANPRTYHQYLGTFDDEITLQLLGFHLKDLGVSYTNEQLLAASELLDGHPFNIRFAAAFARDYGLAALIADPSELIEWKRRRAEDYLQTMEFATAEADILAALLEYRFLATEIIFSVSNCPLAEAAVALRRLQEFSCVERTEGYCHVAPPLREAVHRDPRFERDAHWKHLLGAQICEAIAEYRDDDNVSVSILDAGVMAAAKGVSASPYLSALILPSHLLFVARDHYDGGRHGLCLEFCQRAWSSKDRLPHEARVEVLRLWGLSSIRINNQADYHSVIEKLSAMSDRTANRIRLFLEGFHARIHRRLDDAEVHFRAAWRISAKNQSINRELAKLLVRQRRYNEAEMFARQAHELAPTNPFIIDVLVEVLWGKVQQGEKIDDAELRRLMNDLRRYGDAPGSSFFLTRTAQSELAGRKYAEALASAERAIERTPALVSAYFLRAEARLALHDLAGVAGDIEEIRTLLARAGGSSEGDETRLEELEVRLLLERGLLRQAKGAVEQGIWLSEPVRHRLLQLVAKSVSYNASSVDEELRKWAQEFNPAPGKSAIGKKHSPRRTRQNGKRHKNNTFW